MNDEIMDLGVKTAFDVIQPEEQRVLDMDLRNLASLLV